jgi:fatty-acid desaturase
MIIVLRHVLAQLRPVVVPLGPSQGMGEGFHNTHHAFPTSTRHGLRWWQIDASCYVIRALAWAGLALVPSSKESLHAS